MVRFLVFGAPHSGGICFLGFVVCAMSSAESAQPTLGVSTRMEIKRHRHRPGPWHQWVSLHVRYCSDKECSWSQSFPHQWGSWTSAGPLSCRRTCRTCGQEDRASGVHQWGKWRSFSRFLWWRKCSRCGHVEHSRKPH